jgi:outer membrane protein assembly factor BamB
MVIVAHAVAPTATAVVLQSQNYATATWTVYHGDPRGDGDAASSFTSVNLTSRAWTSPTLDGQVYGEPLVWDSRVYVASENDTVYALSVASGEVAWSTHLGAPVPSSALPCGNISPTVGITGTPVVDTTRSEVFVVADELVDEHPIHELVGLDAATGRVELTQRVDPPGSTPAALLQRTGLALDANRVVFGFGGNYGDCPPYHGWVISVPETGGTAQNYSVDSGAGESQGAIWMGGAAPVVDASGNVWVEAGNGSVTSPGVAYDHSDSVLELTPALSLLQYFAPLSWASENAQDLDLSTAPALLGDGQVVAGGKDGAAYLLDGTHLGGLGGEQTSLARVCAQDIDGGPAIVGTTVYLPCLDGPVAVQVSSNPAGLRLLWRAPAGGGPPIVAAGLVWTVSQSGALYGLNATTGAVVEQTNIGAPANHFATPSFGGSLLLASSATDVVAFHASTNRAAAGTTTSSTPATSSTTRASSSKPLAATGGIPAGTVAAIVLGALAACGGALWLWRRARRGGLAP